MKLRTLGRALLRRWYAFLAGLLAVGALGAFAYGQLPVDYKTTGSVVLLPSAKSVGTEGNPYLFLSGLGQAMDVLTRRLMAPDVMERLTQGSTDASYTAQPDVTSGSSILIVSVKSRSAESAASTLEAVLAGIPAELVMMQDELSVPDAARIASMQVAMPAEPAPDLKPRLQITAVICAAGLLVVLLLTALLDGILLRLARHRTAGRAAPVAGPVRGRGASPRTRPRFGASKNQVGDPVTPRPAVRSDSASAVRDGVASRGLADDEGGADEELAPPVLAGAGDAPSRSQLPSRRAAGDRR